MAKKKTCFIMGAGDFDGMPIYPDADDQIIAADGGYRYLKMLGIEPHVLLGDFDSLDVVPEHRHLIRHSPLKDDTDMALAVAYAVEEGSERFFLYGGMGGRLDHTIANIQLLTGMARRGLEAYLVGKENIVTAIDAECLVFPETFHGILSVFSMDSVSVGIWERGLKYPLSDAVMTCDKTLGVSNEFTGSESSVEVTEGTLLVMWETDNGLPKSRKSRKQTQEQAGEERTRALLSDMGWRSMHRTLD